MPEQNSRLAMCTTFMNLILMLIGFAMAVVAIQTITKTKEILGTGTIVTLVFTILFASLVLFGSGVFGCFTTQNGNLKLYTVYLVQLFVTLLITGGLGMIYITAWQASGPLGYDKKKIDKNFPAEKVSTYESYAFALGLMMFGSVFIQIATFLCSCWLYLRLRTKLQVKKEQKERSDRLSNEEEFQAALQQKMQQKQQQQQQQQQQQLTQQQQQIAGSKLELGRKLGQRFKIPDDDHSSDTEEEEELIKYSTAVPMLSPTSASSVEEENELHQLQQKLNKIAAAVAASTEKENRTKIAAQTPTKTPLLQQKPGKMPSESSQKAKEQAGSPPLVEPPKDPTLKFQKPMPVTEGDSSPPENDEKIAAENQRKDLKTINVQHPVKPVETKSEETQILTEETKRDKAAETEENQNDEESETDKTTNIPPQPHPSPTSVSTATGTEVNKEKREEPPKKSDESIESSPSPTENDKIT